MLEQSTAQPSPESVFASSQASFRPGSILPLPQPTTQPSPLHVPAVAPCPVAPPTPMGAEPPTTTGAAPVPAVGLLGEDPAPPASTALPRSSEWPPHAATITAVASSRARDGRSMTWAGTVTALE